jgi:hypothetical protein
LGLKTGSKKRVLSNKQTVPINRSLVQAPHTHTSSKVEKRGTQQDSKTGDGLFNFLQEEADVYITAPSHREISYLKPHTDVAVPPWIQTHRHFATKPATDLGLVHYGDLRKGFRNVVVLPRDTHKAVFTQVIILVADW